MSQLKYRLYRVNSVNLSPGIFHGFLLRVTQYITITYADLNFSQPPSQDDKEFFKQVYGSEDVSIISQIADWADSNTGIYIDDVFYSKETLNTWRY